MRRAGRKDGTQADIVKETTGGWDSMTLLCAAWNLPMPSLEFRFAVPRRWRFDYAWPSRRVAVEQEGGVWTGGRHTRGKGYLGDLEKYNTAAVAGWCVLRFTPEQIQKAECLPLLQQVLT